MGFFYRCVLVIFDYSFAANWAASIIRAVKKFFTIALLILIPLIHVYEFTESSKHLFHSIQTERKNTVTLKKKEAIMKTTNVTSENQAIVQVPNTKHAGSHCIYKAV